jgi:predicted nucleotidyltransferase
MAKTKESLTEILNERLSWASSQAKRCIAEATEIVIFGSMSAGLERPNSDMDVLCVCNSDYKHKTETLDLIAIPKTAVTAQRWLQSELATHVAEYGRWLEGTPQWRGNARIGFSAIEEKRRRIAAFMKSLPMSWRRLEEGFRVKYSIKLRRETQRLILLERGIAIPPTMFLDHFWAHISKSPYEVCDRLRELSLDAHDDFTQSVLSRIDAHLQPSIAHSTAEGSSLP